MNKAWIHVFCSMPKAATLIQATTMSLLDTEEASLLFSPYPFWLNLYKIHWSPNHFFFHKETWSCDSCLKFTIHVPSLRYLRYLNTIQHLPNGFYTNLVNVHLVFHSQFECLLQCTVCLPSWVLFFNPYIFSLKAFFNCNFSSIIILLYFKPESQSHNVS